MAIRRLKARWRRLSKKIDMYVGNVPNIILACCVLHNICEVHGEWMEELELTEPNVASVSTTTTDDSTVRFLLVNYFENH